MKEQIMYRITVTALVGGLLLASSLPASAQVLVTFGNPFMGIGVTSGYGYGNPYYGSPNSYAPNAQVAPSYGYGMGYGPGAGYTYSANYGTGAAYPSLPSYGYLSAYSGATNPGTTPYPSVPSYGYLSAYSGSAYPGTTPYPSAPNYGYPSAYSGGTYPGTIPYSGGSVQAYRYSSYSAHPYGYQNPAFGYGRGIYVRTR
jgi:hypothetical protein